MWCCRRTIVLVVLFYYVVSISLVLLNKMVLNSRSLPYPLFVSWTQLAVAVVCIWLLSLLKRWHAAPLSSDSNLLLTTLLSRIGGCRRPGLTSALPSISLEFDLDKARQILPLAVIYVLMMATNNLCLHYVQVSFYQAATALPSNPPPRLPWILISLFFLCADCSISHNTLLNCLHFVLPADRDVGHGSFAFGPPTGGLTDEVTRC